MRFMKRLGIVLVLIAAMAFTACSSKDEKPTETKKTQDVGKKSEFTVGIIVGEKEKESSEFVKSALNGLESFEDKTACAVMVETVNDETEIESKVEKLSKDCNLIWTVGTVYGTVLADIAEKYPDINFAVVDGQYENTPDNVTGVGFRSNEAAFLAGYIAAYKSQSGKVGFIGGMDNDVINGFRAGYEAGAKYYDDKIEIVAEYVGDFLDKDKAKTIAKDMYDSGCDVIFPAAGVGSVAVIEEAVAQGKYVIGVDADQSNLGEDAVVTSVLKMVDSAVEYVCLRAKEGIDIGGKNLNYGLADGAVGITEYDEKFIPLSEQNKLDNIKEMIVSDRMVVPNTIEELSTYKPVRE